MKRLALLLCCGLGLVHSTATVAAAQSASGITVTVRPLLLEAPIFGATIDLPRLPSAPSVPGGGDDGSDASGSTDISLNGAYMFGVQVDAPRWFTEVTMAWAKVAADAPLPRITVDNNNRIFNARGGVRLFHGLAATVGVRYVHADLDVTLTLPLINKTLEGRVSPSLWDPLIGADWQGKFGDRWTVEASFQGGGFGVGTDVDLSSQATVDWRFAGSFVLRGGYAVQYFKLTLGDISIGSFQRTLVTKQTLQGPIIGLGYVF